MRTVLFKYFVVISMFGVTSVPFAEEVPKDLTTNSAVTSGSEDDVSAPPAQGETPPITVESILAQPPRERAPAATDVSAANAPPPAPEEIKAIRVPYIPEIVKQEIRNQIRAELRQDVVQDVLTQAKDERWGVPGVLPEWIDRIKIKGDLRLRAQVEAYGDDNFPNTYPDYLSGNKVGGWQRPTKPWAIPRIAMRCCSIKPTCSSTI